MDFKKNLRYLVSHYRINISIVLAILFFILAKPNMISIALGLPFLLLGEAIRLFSSGYIQKNSILAQEGPYSLSRNPLYLGNFFLGFGFGVMAFQIYLMGFYLVFFYFIYDTTIKEEEKKLLVRFGSVYETYFQKVPRFFPKSPGLGSWNGKFSWALVKKHRELNTCYGILFGIGIFFLKMMILEV